MLFDFNQTWVTCEMSPKGSETKKASSDGQGLWTRGMSRRMSQKRST